MDSWDGLRTAAIIVVWVTVAGGALMALIWMASGGFRAIGPEDDLTGGDPAARLPHKAKLSTAFSSSHVLVHGLLGLLTAALVTYGATLDDDRTGGYIFLIVSILVTAIPGARMFLRWRSGERPHVARLGEQRARGDDRRVEDRLPKPVVYLHGLAALSTLGIVVALLVLD